MKEFGRIPTESLSKINDILRPPSALTIDLYSSAQEVLTDFHLTQPLMIEQGTGIPAARELMKRSHVRLKLVIDSDEQFKGIISLADLMSVKVMRAREKTGLSLEELTVGDIMTPKSELHAIDSRQVRNASIGDLLYTMKSLGDQHVLVVDTDSCCISGIVSSSDIARRLHIPLYISERANSFSEIYQAVHG